MYGLLYVNQLSTSPHCVQCLMASAPLYGFEAPLHMAGGCLVGECIGIQVSYLQLLSRMVTQWLCGRLWMYISRKSE